MKKSCLLLTSCLSCLILSAQNKNTWSWEGGDISSYPTGIYGTKGVANFANHPGERAEAVSWKNASGELWLFGGHRYFSSGLYPAQNLNDLWKYNASTNLWTWISGDNTTDQPGVYGTKGIPAVSNKPGARQGAITWNGADGSLWLYGGFYLDNVNARFTAYFGDLWKYEPASNLWTWVNGSNVSSTRSVHGTKGVANDTNTPGARNSAISWTDAAGNFWLLGGTGFASNGFGIRNDLWKYNSSTNQWAWMSGDTTAAVFGNNTSLQSVFGTKGIADAANKPGARSGAVGWTDASGNIWLFGGRRDLTGPVSSTIYFNDLWKYDITTNQWAWISGDSTVNTKPVYGTQSIAASSNTPGGRSGAQSWSDSSGGFWLFGGLQEIQGITWKTRNDLWKYEPMTNLWAWIGGDSSLDAPGVYGTKGIPAVTNKPAARSNSLSWRDATGNFWLFGGYGKPVNGGNHNFNDLWKLDVNTGQWTWTSGDASFYPLSAYGIKGIASVANKPAAREEAVSWTDASGDLWLFGGGTSLSPYYTNYFHDLWKLDHVSKQWALVNGDTLVNQKAVYGSKGVPDATTNPGARKSAISLTDNNGNLWLFGGLKTLESGSIGTLNDLWMYDPRNDRWTWVSGDSTVSTLENPRRGLYGLKGIANAANKPSPRFNSVGLKDNNGNLWLFGGACFNLYADGTLNDLWKFDMSNKQWTWMSGDSIAADYQHPLPPVYGTKGVADPANKPGAKAGAAGWKDTAGNLWLFSGSSGLNDLWKYDLQTNLWTYVQGDPYLGQKPVYGKKGVAAPENWPGPKNNSVSWTDAYGKCWLFGGSGANDLWQFDPGNVIWTWMSGDTILNAKVAYGTKGTTDSANAPGARVGAVGWSDLSGSLWMFGGSGDNGSHYIVYLNDLWKFSTSEVALPVKISRFSALKYNNQVIVNWNTTEDRNTSYFMIQRSADGIRYDSIGSVTAKTGLPDNSYQFVDLNPYKGNNYYRLKEVDNDGHYSYSTIKNVFFDIPDFSYAIIRNPVYDHVMLNIISNEAVTLQLQITNADGHLLYRRQSTVPLGNTLLSLPASNLKKGIYFLTVKTPKSSVTKSFLKN